MKFHYVNSNNEKLDLSVLPYIVEEGDVFDWIYGYDTKAGLKNKSIGFTKEAVKRKLRIAIALPKNTPVAKRGVLWSEAVNNLTRCFDVDVLNGADGRLYTDNGYYLSCKIIGAEKDDISMNVPIMSCTFTVLSDNPVWIKEELRRFYPTDGGKSPVDIGGLDYQYDYAYDYSAGKGGNERWIIDHYAHSDFIMTIYGPCINPKILINGYPYEMFTTLESGEYLMINSAEKEVYKYLINGQALNIFDLRGKVDSVFKPIPSGNLAINWSGDFGFDITLFLERSEPAW